MNNVLLGLEQSPLYQSILEGSSYQDFVYKLQDSLGAISKHRMEIPFSSVEANTNISFDLPEYGLVHRMYLRMTIRNSATDAGNSLVLDTGYFANLFSRISLISHSREIEQLTPLALLQYVLSQPATKKASLKKLVDYASNPIGGQITNSVKPSLSQAEFQADTANAEMAKSMVEYVHKYVNYESDVSTQPNIGAIPGYRYVYIPLNFNFFNGNGFRSIKDLAFLEKLTVSCQFGALFQNNDLKRPQGTDFNNNDVPSIVQSNTTIGGVNVLGSALIVDYLHLPNSQLRAYENAQFRMENGKPLSMLSGNVATETVHENTHTLSQSNPVSIYKDIPINCKNVCYKTILAVKDISKGANDFEPLHKIELWLSGRKVQEYNTMEELRMENLFELGTSTSRPSGVGANFGQQSGQPMFNAACNTSTDIVCAGNHTTNVVEADTTNNIEYDAYNRQKPNLIEHYENVYTLNHGIERNPLNRCGGCISFKGVSSPFVRIYHYTPIGTGPNQTRTYKYSVEHAHYQINSISGADGSCAVSLSL